MAASDVEDVDHGPIKHGDNTYGTVKRSCQSSNPDA